MEEMVKKQARTLFFYLTLTSLGCGFILKSMQHYTGLFRDYSKQDGALQSMVHLVSCNILLSAALSLLISNDACDCLDVHPSVAFLCKFFLRDVLP